MMDSSNLVMPVVTTVIIVSCFALVFLRPLFKARRAVHDPSRPAVELTGDGTINVPVLATHSQRSGFMWRTRATSFSKPSLVLTPGGLRFHVLRDDGWPYAEIEQVDVRKPLLSDGRRILFLGDNNRRLLSADIRDAESAAQVLAALPRSLPFSVDAATLRDGNAAAATPGLKRYNGPTQ